jgi:hypothetical protein
MESMRIIQKKTKRGTWERPQAGLIPKNQIWFYHPEMQARVSEAEADFRNGRYTRTESLEAAQAHLDGLKRH